MPEETEAPFEVDWDDLDETVENTQAWLYVDNTTIDYPVLQYTDNQYYLSHDAFGNSSRTTVFMDYRAEQDGRNIIIYAHTHSTVMGFHELAEVDEQYHLNQIGTVWYFTPARGTRAYKPIAGLYVWPDFPDVQEFSFEPTDEAVAEKVEAVLAEHYEKGEWNLACLASDVPAVSSDNCVLIKAVQGPADVTLWWVVTEKEMKQIRYDCEIELYREWLENLVSQASAQMPGWQDDVSKSTECVVLACCSWPFDNHRTLMVCVR